MGGKTNTGQVVSGSSGLAPEIIPDIYLPPGSSEGDFQPGFEPWLMEGLTYEEWLRRQQGLPGEVELPPPPGGPAPPPELVNPEPGAPSTAD